MWDEFFALLHGIGFTLLKIVPVSIALALVFSALSFSGPAIRGSRGGASASS